MQTYIALLRGINVGGNNVLPMKSLVSLLEEDGCQCVKTYIQSGNVVFKAETIDANKISEMINMKFGFLPKVLLFNFSELQVALSECPYLTVGGEVSEGKTVHFYFCDSEPKLNLEQSEKISSLCSESEQYTLNGSVFYLYAPNGIGRSKLAAKVEPYLGVGVTARNLNTVRKLLTMQLS